MTRQEKIDLLMKTVQVQANELINNPTSPYTPYTPSEVMVMHDDMKAKYEGMNDVQPA